MLVVNQISKSFGNETILKSISFSVNAGERLALIGPNGCGKSTLLSIIDGRLKPDAGHIGFSSANVRTGYLTQGGDFLEDDTIGRYLDRCEGNLAEMTRRLEILSRQLVETPQSEALQEEYDQILSQMESVSEGSHQGAVVVANMGLGHFPPETPVAHLSGGQKTRLSLAGVLVANPHFLMLDEPTNHLDLAMLEWLEEWLLNFSGGVLYVSHDRAFVDRTATGILEINPDTQSSTQFAGNYTDYLEEKVTAREKQWQEYTDQQEEIARLKKAVNRRQKEATYKAGGKADSDKFAKGFYSARSIGTIKRAKALEKRIDFLSDEGKVEKPQQSWQMKIDFEEIPSSGEDVVLLEDLAVGYGEHVLLQHLNQTIRLGERVALIGENGKGKTTLLRTIAGLIPPLDGRARLGANVQVGYMAQEQEELDPHSTPLRTLRSHAPLSETDTRTFLSYFLFTGDEVFIPVGRLSYGERARLSLACWVVRGVNFLMLDEPINHLDIPSRTRFEQAMTAYEGTVLAVVHDRYFIDGFATQIWEINDQTLTVRDAVSRF